MRIHYYRAPDGNFGDDLNAWLWNALIPDAIGIDAEMVMLGIGTLLNRATTDRYPAARRWAAMGSGAGYGAPPRGIDRDGWLHVTLRGPLSAHVLGAPAERAVTDGAILLARLACGAALPAAARQGVVFMPHHHGPDLPFWREACRLAGIVYVDPTADSMAILRTLRGAKLVLADAMHAAIVADTLRVPWLPLVSSTGISMFKWLDWTLSMALPYEPAAMPMLAARTRRSARALRWFEAVQTFGDRSFAGAVDHYQIGLRTSTSVARRLRRRAKRTVYKSLVAPLTPIAAEGERERAEAAGFLSAMAGRSGFLSDDAVFSDRLARMSERLDAVAAVARGC